MEAQRKKVLGKEMPENDEFLKLEKESLEKERKELVEQIVSYQNIFLPEHTVGLGMGVFLIFFCHRR